MVQVFVSGQIGDVDTVRKVQDSFIEAGHRITHDWTHNEVGDKLLAGSKAKFDNPDEAARRAELDMQGVIESDIYVICTDNEKPGKGMYVELGGALALHKTTGKPLIFLLGAMAHSSIFYFDRAVYRVESVQTILDQI